MELSEIIVGLQKGELVITKKSDLKETIEDVVRGILGYSKTTAQITTKEAAKELGVTPRVFRDMAAKPESLLERVEGSSKYWKSSSIQREKERINKTYK
jgi:F0F1-type ATP synthase epsilon subunit